MGRGEGGSEAVGFRVRAVSRVVGQVVHCQARIFWGRDAGAGVVVLVVAVVVAMVVSVRTAKLAGEGVRR